MKKILTIATLILSFLGFLDATYLTILHYKNAIPPCSIAHGCEIVLTSKYAMLGPLPIALVGAFYYLTLLISLILFLETKKKLFFFFALVISCISIFVSIFLVYLQAGVLHAFCQYCLTSEGINGVIFVCMLLSLSFVSQKISSED